MITYKLEQFEVPLLQKSNIKRIIAGIVESDVLNAHIERLSLDCRRKGRPHFVCNAVFSVEHELSGKKNLSRYFGNMPEKLNTRKLVDKYKKYNSMPSEVSIVGAGPAGLWAAYALLLCGHKVNLYEQGKPVEERFGDIRRFLKGGVFLEHSNIFFGEGEQAHFQTENLTQETARNFHKPFSAI